MRVSREMRRRGYNIRFMLGLVVAVVFVLVVGLGVLGGYLLVAMKRRIDDDRALDDAGLKAQSDALLVAKGDLSTQLTAVTSSAKDAQAAQGLESTKVDGLATSVGTHTTEIEGLATSFGTHTTEIEQDRVRMNEHIATYGSNVTRIDEAHDTLSGRVDTLDGLAPVATRLKDLYIDETGIKVCGFESPVTCRTITFAPV